MLVASNVPEARGLVLAKRLGIQTWSKSHEGMTREEFDAALDAALRAHDVELVALAGYMRLLSDGFVGAWEGRILNIHPCLLPLHKGLDTHRRALIAGDEYAGCSVHLVTADLDSGPVLAQAKVQDPAARRRRQPRRARARGGAPPLSDRARRILPGAARGQGLEIAWAALSRRSLRA